MKHKFNIRIALSLALLFIVLSIVSASAFAARPCKSDADAKAEAVKFCTAKLNCPTGQIVDCKGTAGRWICRCKKGPGSEIEEISLIEESIACAENEALTGQMSARVTLSIE